MKKKKCSITSVNIFYGLIELLDLRWKDTFDKVVSFNPELTWYAQHSVMLGEVPHIYILVLQEEKKKWQQKAQVYKHAKYLLEFWLACHFTTIF